ncbi:MFS transporter [Yinghuangia seranimata]|uniref:MFS transporter n=1 Tax=Yinghuangia seranimata TaxID=408067 RepID=UPI00248C3256|nr:MFS transporter [Yinghuangia seranimata]MDI2130606.1 MFS transporter [Yinghuangia seranimata]
MVTSESPARTPSRRPRPAADERAARPGLTLALIAFAQLIVALDYNIVYVALPDIGDALGFSAQSLQWVVSAYAVGIGGFLLLGGRAVDRLGARRMFTLGLAIYGAASLAGGLAGNSGFLIAARAVQGLGGALLSPATLALIFARFEEGPARNRAMGAWGLAGSSGLAVGALSGGLLTEWLGWRSIFFVNVPLVAVVLAGAAWLLRDDAPPARARGGFDLPGALLATAGSSLLVFGLVSGPDAGWTSPRALGGILVGAALLGLFLLVEARTREPLMPLRMLRNRTLSVSMLLILLFQSALGAGYYLFTMYLQPVLGYSALQAGLAFVPLTLVCAVAASKTAPALIGRFGLRGTLAVGMLVTGLGIGLTFAVMTVGGSFWALLPGTMVWGFGGGWTFVAMFVAAGAGVSPQEQGVAAGLANTAGQIGGAIGLAIIIAVVNARSGDASTPHALLTGIHLGGWVAAIITATGAAVALLLARPSAAASPVIAKSTQTDTPTDTRESANA